MAEDRQARNELALRLFRVMADIIRNREAIRSISVQIDGLETQFLSPANQQPLRRPSGHSPTSRQLICSATEFLPSGSLMSAQRTTTCCL